MIAEMSINVVRYEMFLREVAPNNIKAGFLDCFMKLPQSFYSPGAPAKFQDFILRYGTHFVKAAKFGGQFKVVKQKELTAETKIADFRKETQGEFNSIVGSVFKYLGLKGQALFLFEDLKKKSLIGVKIFKFEFAGKLRK